MSFLDQVGSGISLLIRERERPRPVATCAAIGRGMSRF
jgi:hypothetical protein